MASSGPPLYFCALRPCMNPMPPVTTLMIIPSPTVCRMPLFPVAFSASAARRSKLLA